MGAIATVLRLFGRGLRQCLFLILMAFRVPVILILRGVGNLLLLATPVLGIFFYSSGLMASSNLSRGLPIFTVVCCPIVGFICLFVADGYDRLLLAIQPRSTVLILPR